jgi:hypothetical protein
LFNGININPFITHGYVGPDYFCNRKVEYDPILEANTIQKEHNPESRRELGKTGSIKHVFKLLPKSYFSHWMDLLPTQSFAQWLQRSFK